MKKYSARGNLVLMGQAFYRPQSVIRFFLEEVSIVYALIPLALFIALFETTYALDYVDNAPAMFHLLGDLLRIPGHEWNFRQIFLLPVVHVGDFFVLGGVAWLLLKILRINAVDVGKTLVFAMFVWNTVGLAGFVTETLSAYLKLDFPYFMQPVYLVVSILYVSAFMYKQTGKSKLKIAIVGTIAVFSFIAFRMVFLG